MEISRNVAFCQASRVCQAPPVRVPHFPPCMSNASSGWLRCTHPWVWVETMHRHPVFPRKTIGGSTATPRPMEPRPARPGRVPAAAWPRSNSLICPEIRQGILSTPTFRALPRRLTCRCSAAGNDSGRHQAREVGHRHRGSMVAHPVIVVE